MLFKTDQNPADLPVSGSTVDTEALEEEGAEEAGEVEAEAGETATGTFDVTEAKYAMICSGRCRRRTSRSSAAVSRLGVEMTGKR